MSVSAPALGHDQDPVAIPDAEHIADIIWRRSGRASKSILTEKDRLDGSLPAGASDQLRRVVLSEINDLAELAVQLVESLAARCNQPMVNNELYQRKIDEIHAAIVLERPDDE